MLVKKERFSNSRRAKETLTPITLTPFADHLSLTIVMVRTGQ